jgi:DNA-binding winged helix-turn-helix (wHTH) protein/Tol biopolymer transport system component
MAHGTTCSLAVLASVNRSRGELAATDRPGGIVRFRTGSALQNGFRVGEFYQVDQSLNSVTEPAGTTRLEPKVMQVLVCLAEHAGEVVTKERLMRTVWPDAFVSDDVLTRCISELRRVFGDDAKEPRFIQTIPKSGYRLIAAVSSNAERDLAAPRQDGTKEQVAAVAQATRHKLVLMLLGVVLITAVAVGGWWIASTRRAPGGLPRQPTMTQLTANPPDLPVTSARISPDGKYLAYADPTGIQVRFIDTGETQRIADTRGMEVYAWSGDGTKIRAAACDTATCTGWDLSLVGSTRRRSGAVWPVTDSVISTPDGSRLLRITQGSRELWVDPVDGSAPRHLVDLGPNGSASWSADGERVLFTKGDTPSAVESMPLAGGSSSVVFKAADAQGIANTGLQLRDGRLLTLLIDTKTHAVAVWEVPIDGSSGVARGSPRRLTEWRAAGASIGPFSELRVLSASSDGKRVAFKGDMSHVDIYVARFDERHGRLLDTPRRLTTDERGSWPGAWTPDGKTILFDSGQSGSKDIFTQSLKPESTEPLVVGPGHQILPRMSSDGQWVLFQELALTPGWPIMRVPLAGGRPEQVLAPTGVAWPRCAVRGRCVLFEQDKDRWIISSLDPVRGKGERLCSIPFNTRGQDLSPDGNAVALVVEDSRSMNRIRIYSLRGELQKDVVVENASALVNLDWGGTGAGFFSSNQTPDRSELLFIRPDGRSRVLWSQQGAPVAAIPSPDGTHLAIAGWTRQSNVWMLTGF